MQALAPDREGRRSVIEKVLNQQSVSRSAFRVAATLACAAAGLLAPAADAAPLPLNTPAVNGPVFAVAIDGSGRTYLGGVFTLVGGMARNDIARLNADGTLDLTWNPNATSNSVNAIAVSGTDVYVGGNFTMIGGQSRNNIAKLSTGTGLADTMWNPNATDIVHALAVSGSDLYVGGDFNGANSIGGQARNRVAKLSTTTGLAEAGWSANASGGANNGSARALAVSGPDLFVGGYFDTFDGVSRGQVAKVSTTGGVVDPNWDEPAGDTVFALAVLGTAVFVGGTAGIKKLTTIGRGSEDPLWGLPGNASPDDTVRAIAVSGSDLYAGGDFTGANSIGGQARNHLAKLSTTGTGPADPVWDPNPDDYVSALAASGSRLAAGGAFEAVGPSLSTEGIALFGIEPPPVTPTPTTEPPPGGGSAPATGTGQRAAALKKCKKKQGSARKKCKKKALKLPV